MLARNGLCQCLCVASRCSIEVVGRIELVYGKEASFDQSFTVFQGNSGIYSNNDTSHWNFFLNSGLRNFATAYRLSNVLST